MSFFYTLNIKTKNNKILFFKVKNKIKRKFYQSAGDQFQKNFKTNKNLRDFTFANNN